MSQSSNTVVMVRPHYFASNPETMADNAFQSVAQQGVNVAKAAYDEVTKAAEVLQSKGVKVHLFDDEGTETPDSVFPNNWFSTHRTGELVLYPMYCSSRRKERRTDIIEFLRTEYGYEKTLDLSSLEQRHVFLEGTGSVVFDHNHKVAYAARSKRMDEGALSQLCERLGYEPIVFDATSGDGKPVYHTNVLMAVGSDFVMASLDMIRNPEQKQRVIRSVEACDKALVPLTEQQINHFAGNTLELDANGRKILAISETAYRSLNTDQVQQLKQWVELLPIAVPTIELGGGSIRCMLAQIFPK
ncbi:citrulline utilization hydrolase CtlX [Idiomarina sp. HP20-50]|uniref:citrulline utilization hydrolase CtlX n=1 Tax=Idiomarina sp. HP20-50 TaxID=3070813 RepID=UPI00294B0FEC|nr:arginine deiminase-related protein [Idiomarina sp. HP20-50]MDV6316596.1 arginine deiminase-related protein [Idiomarina sp. HP20-50]